MTKDTVIEFYAEAAITQVVHITEEDLTPEQLVAGLNSGELMTTLEHRADRDDVRTIVRFDEQGNDVAVAEILSQQVNDDVASYKDFELSESD